MKPLGALGPGLLGCGCPMLDRHVPARRVNVNFPDPNLEAAVRSELQHTPRTLDRWQTGDTSPVSTPVPLPISPISPACSYATDTWQLFPRGRGMQSPT